MERDLARAQAGIEGRRAALEGDIEADLVAIVGEALQDVLHGEDGRAAAHHRTSPRQVTPHKLSEGTAEENQLLAGKAGG
jgi:hypothetical protein